MRIEQLRYLIYVAETGSISRSAADLCISQQGLSKSIQQMESELGTKLIVRSGNRMQLTSAGCCVINHMRNILEEYESIVNVCSKSSIQRKAEIDIWVTPRNCYSVMTSVLKQASEMLPRTRINVIEVPLTGIIESFFGSELPQMIIMNIPKKLHYSTREADRLPLEIVRRDCVHAMVSTQSEFADRPCLTGADLGSAPMAVLSGDENLLRDNFSLNWNDIQVVMVTTSIQLYKDYLKNNPNIMGFCTKFIERSVKPASRVLIPLIPQVEILSGCILCDNAKDDPICKELYHIAKREFLRIEPDRSIPDEQTGEPS